MKIKKKIWGCLLSLLCIFMLVLPVMASESPETDSEVSAVTSEESAVPTENPAIPEERQKPLLVDNAGLLTEEESNALLNKLEDISQKYENEVGIVTVNSLEGKTAEAYADDYYDYNGYGYGENDDGLLLPWPLQVMRVMSWYWMVWMPDLISSFSRRSTIFSSPRSTSTWAATRSTCRSGSGVPTAGR